ncbi:leukocyte surface antigen CD47 isoform X1 [Mesocricetus auratus]|uniref:Leukocyte surface antigen CD47 n=1 Tax=Mesocricetus auratus TaxID=10036 RepID=A0A1U8BYM2_MESAU|nr:leukocyte surface antigen CD47 isoform X1 [Mesocricetus auratus]
MWPLVAALLLGSCCCGSAQLLFSKVKSAEFTTCNETVVIPCVVLNVEAQSTEEMYVKWKLNKTYIFIYDGSKNNSSVETNFSSAKISLSDLLKGVASLKMDRQQAVVGNYTCEVTELSREGKTVIELKYRVDLNPDPGSDCSYHTTPTPAGDEKEKGGCKLASWFSPNEKILIVIFPILAILLFWGKFGILTLKYKSTRTNKRIILLLVAGLVLTVIVVVGAILLIPGENPVKSASGLGLIVISIGTLILLQYNVFMTAFGMTSFTIAILITQVLGYVLALVGLCLCIMACEPVHGPLLISGLGIIALAELLGLVYMKFVASNQRTIQPPRKAVEEPLNAFKESKGMMNDE